MFRRFLLVCTTILSACSIESSNCTDVNQAKIHQTYSASYDAKDDSTTATATLRFDGATGNTLIMDGKCALKHDTISLARSTFLGTSYSGSKSGYVPAHTFTFTDNNSKDFVNSITSAQTVALSNPPSTVKRTDDLTLNFTPGVATGETVEVYVEYTSSQPAATRLSAWKSTSAQGATSATISKSDLAEMTVDGAVYLYAKRTLSKDLGQPTESQGGGIYYYYYSARSNATIGNN